MKSKITEELLDQLGILAKLDVSGPDREQLHSDLERMLAYVDKLGELNTDGAEPLTHFAEYGNVFREDTVRSDDTHEQLRSLAPKQEGAYYAVPGTLVSEPV